jgi:hypothetical protein
MEATFDEIDHTFFGQIVFSDDAIISILKNECNYIDG